MDLRKYQHLVICLILILTCIFSTACNEERLEDLGEQYVEGSDWQSGFGSGSLPRIQKAGKGYYFLVSQHLYYYEQSMEQAVPVCNKADCSHTDETCNASMGDGPEINYYDHKFYYIASENNNAEKWYLYFLSEDGRQREKVAQIATLDPSDNGVHFEFCVHRGNVYFSVSKGATLKKRKAVVERISLNGSLDRKEVASVEGYGAAIENLQAFGNTLVITGCYADSVDSDFRTHTDFVDIRNGKERKDILYDKERDLVMIYKKEDDVFYYDSNKLYRLNMDSNKREEVTKEMKIYAECSFQGQYLYSCNWYDCHEKNDYRNYGIDIIDEKGEKTGKIPLEENMEWEFGDNDYCFAFAYDDGKYMVKQFDKSRLSEKDAEWKDILVLGEDSDGGKENILE